MEKFFKEEGLSILMKEISSDGLISSERGADECYSIAESMIEEINQISLPKRSEGLYSGTGQKGSFRKRLIRQLREARKLAMI
jgi:hypothetical protein